MFNPSRPGAFAPLWAVVVLVATVVSLVVNVGPAVAALVAPTVPVTVAVAAPLAPVTVAAEHAADDQAVGEDDPRWDCRAQGNRICGYGTVSGPVGTLAGGTLAAWCPPGGRLVDLPWMPLGPTTDLPTIMGTVGCRY